MVLHGRIENGVVVFSDPASLPNGAEVTVIVPAANIVREQGRPVQLPLVPSKHPGSRKFSAETIAELLADDDLPTGR